MGYKIEQRKMMTTREITKLKQEAAKRQQAQLEDKVMLNGTWEKGTSHLYWSQSDSSAIVGRPTSSLLAVDPSVWLGYHLGSTVGSEHATAPYFVGRPVTPIIWNSSKRTEPYVVETPRQWDYQGAEDESLRLEVEEVPATLQPRKERPRTSAGVTTSLKPNQEVARPTTAAPPRTPAPFQSDLVPLESRYAFETKKRIMMERTMRSKEKRKMGQTAKKWRVRDWG